jgi:hypothetical protein
MRTVSGLVNSAVEARRQSQRREIASSEDPLPFTGTVIVDYVCRSRTPPAAHLDPDARSRLDISHVPGGRPRCAMILVATSLLCFVMVFPRPVLRCRVIARITRPGAGSASAICLVRPPSRRP